MQLFFSPASPYVRKVLVAAIELGLESRIQKLPSAASPVERDSTIAEHNPTGKVPTLLTVDNGPLYDSRVICEYLAAQVSKQALFPEPGPARWRALRQQALGDGLLDAALLARYETIMRPEALRWEPWLRGQLDKMTLSVTHIEDQVRELKTRLDIGTLTLACALGYLDFRFPDLDWRTDNPETADWFEQISLEPSLVATQPSDG